MLLSGAVISVGPNHCGCYQSAGGVLYLQGPGLLSWPLAHPVAVAPEALTAHPPSQHGADSWQDTSFLFLVIEIVLFQQYFYPEVSRLCI